MWNLKILKTHLINQISYFNIISYNVNIPKIYIFSNLTNYYFKWILNKKNKNPLDF